MFFLAYIALLLTFFTHALVFERKMKKFPTFFCNLSQSDLNNLMGFRIEMRVLYLNILFCLKKILCWKLQKKTLSQLFEFNS